MNKEYDLKLSAGEIQKQREQFELNDYFLDCFCKRQLGHLFICYQEEGCWETRAAYMNAILGKLKTVIEEKPRKISIPEESIHEVVQQLSKAFGYMSPKLEHDYCAIKKFTYYDSSFDKGIQDEFYVIEGKLTIQQDNLEDFTVQKLADYDRYKTTVPCYCGGSKKSSKLGFKRRELRYILTPKEQRYRPYQIGIMIERTFLPNLKKLDVMIEKMASIKAVFFENQNGRNGVLPNWSHQLICEHTRFTKKDFQYGLIELLKDRTYTLSVKRSEALKKMKASFACYRPCTKISSVEEMAYREVYRLLYDQYIRKIPVKEYELGRKSFTVSMEEVVKALPVVVKHCYANHHSMGKWKYPVEIVQMTMNSMDEQVTLYVYEGENIIKKGKHLREYFSKNILKAYQKYSQYF